MNWTEIDCGEHRLIRNGVFVARLLWIGNIWLCHAFLSSGENETSSEVTLSEAKAWAERQLG